MIAFWMLNDASTIHDKIAYMRACRSGGIEALAMHCRSGNLIPYASSEWFEMTHTLVGEGKRLGIDMWLYDEDPFPSGGAGGLLMAKRKDLRAEYLACHQLPKSLKPGQLWFISRSRVIWAGLVPVSEPIPSRDLTDTVGSVRADWFMTKWNSQHYYQDTPVFPCPRGDTVYPQFTMRVPLIPTGYKLIALTAELAGTNDCWGSLPDLLNSETFNIFKELTLDKYERYVGSYYGKTIPGIFTDEAKPHGVMPITKDIFENFNAKYGYDLRSRLYQLFGNPMGDEYAKTRLDYRQWVLDRFLNVFVRPYREYCDKHNLHLVGHFSPEDDPIHEVICLGSVMPVMKLMSCAGTDIIVPYTGNSRAPALNLGSLRAASVKSQNRQPCAISESLALSGWQVTSEQCRQIFAWQKTLGIDRFFTHGFFMSNEGVQNYEAPPDFGPYSSIFKGMCVINDWLKEIDALMDGATERADIAVVNSIASFGVWAPDMSCSHLRQLRKSVWLILLSCLRAHVGVHLVDEPDLSLAHVRSGASREGSPAGFLDVGARSYSTLIVPRVDFMCEASFCMLQSAVESGVSVFWFGGGPKRLLDPDRRFIVTPIIRGVVLKETNPGDAWCRCNLPNQASIKGRNKEDCYVRRFTSRDGFEYLLAANVSDKELALQLDNDTESGLSWMPKKIDGDAITVEGGVVWTVPPRGAGLFILEKARAMNSQAVLPEPRALNLDARTFERAKTNILRLTRTLVRRKGEPAFIVDYPRPYWRLFEDYSTSERVSSFAGDVPVKSDVSDGDLRYLFTVVSSGKFGIPQLVLDPRCARGRFCVFLNGKPLGPVRVFPLDRKGAQMIPLRGLRLGANRIELRFHIESAMEGLLSQLYVEGDFDADVSKSNPVIFSPRRWVSKSGWQASGMPHYMGEGLYRWCERFSTEDIARSWMLVLDKIVDSAELFVNGETLGSRAWAPWSWKLPSLKRGDNIFELLVSGNAGNKHELVWPNQAQGWIGGGCLTSESSC